MQSLKDQNGETWKHYHYEHEITHLELIAKAIAVSRAFEGIGIIENICTVRKNEQIAESVNEYIEAVGADNPKGAAKYIERAYNCLPDWRNVELAVLSAIANGRIYDAVGLVEKIAPSLKHDYFGLAIAIGDVVKLVNEIALYKPKNSVELLSRINAAYDGLRDDYGSKVKVAVAKAIESMMSDNAASKPR